MLFTKNQLIVIFYLTSFISIAVDMKIIFFTSVFYVVFFITMKYLKYGIPYFQNIFQNIKSYIINPKKLLNKSLEFF